jgi:hypothetical protein
MQEHRVLSRSRVREWPYLHLDAGGPKSISAARSDRIRIRHGRENPSHA